MKYALSVLLIAGVCFAFSVRMNAESPAINFFAVEVARVDTAVQWYSKNFGMEVVNKYIDDQQGYKVYILKSPTMMLELMELAANKGMQRGDDKMFRICKVGFGIRNFDQFYASLQANKVNFFGPVHTDPRTKKRNFLIRDPEGNFLQFLEE